MFKCTVALQLQKLEDLKMNKERNLSPPNISLSLFINPTYRALPVSLHHELTFLFFFFSLPPSLSLLFLFFFLQQTCSRENYWRWGVWEKQELLPGAGRASHGRHESAERCGTEEFSSSLYTSSFSPPLPQSLALTCCQSYFSLLVVAVSPRYLLRNSENGCRICRSLSHTYPVVEEVFSVYYLYV